MARIVALGAELQAASSLAEACSDREVLLVSDQAVVDGWDIPNVEFKRATPHDWHAVAGDDDEIVPLCARWLPDEDWSLTSILPRVARSIGDAYVVPVQTLPEARGIWQVKGNRWHRPDSTMLGPANDLLEVTDTHGCCLVYQPRLMATGTVMAIGRRSVNGITLGLFRVFDERFFRIAILQAAESIVDSELSRLSCAAAEALDHCGFFTQNWLLTGNGPRLTSFRPAPRAAFGAFRRGGIDLFAPHSGVRELRAGLRFVAQPHYASYTRLET